MSKAEEFQKQLEEIESEANYVYPSDTMASFRLLVDEMLAEMENLEKINREQALYLANTKRTHEFIQQLKLETSDSNKGVL